MPLCNWRYGTRSYINARIATAKVVADNYCVGMNADVLVLASDTTWNTDLATTRADWKALFLGIADQIKTSTTNARIPGNSIDNVLRTCVQGVYDIPIVSAVVKIGDWFAPTKDTGNALIDTTFTNVTTASTTGVLRAVESSFGVAVTTARVAIVSTLGADF